MKLVHFYLNFPGHTREAFDFYARVFGTQILFAQTFGEATFMGDVPESAKDKIVHIQLPITETIHLMGSDAIPGMGRDMVEGNNFSLTLVADDKAEADRVFAALADQGAVDMPLANAPWGPYFGMVRDRYGVNWMVSLEGPA
jgi:PhnB protein